MNSIECIERSSFFKLALQTSDNDRWFRMFLFVFFVLIYLELLSTTTLEVLT